MKIAFIGWGSLIWDKRELLISSEWHPNGPMLPIEFARVSPKDEDERVTLVINPGSEPVQCLWALSASDTIEAAVESLRKREGIELENKELSIGVWSRIGRSQDSVECIIDEWMQNLVLGDEHVILDAVVWTKLKPRFKVCKESPTVDDIIEHLKNLPPEKKIIAEAYVRKAPKQIITAYRQKIEEIFKWTPTGII